MVSTEDGAMGRQERVLLMTVGMGGGDVRGSLLEPMKKSMRNDRWARIVLVPSSSSVVHAETLRAECPDLPVEVERPLGPGEEEDTDACFAAFETILDRLRARGWPSALVVADITRGTKVMSAALALAAAGAGVGVLRYVSGDRGPASLVVAGTERVRDMPVARIAARQRLDLAAHLLQRMQFASVEEVLREAKRARLPAELEREASCLDWLARFWGAWDRFDYRCAAELGCEPPDAWTRDLDALCPRPDQSEHLRTLARGLPPKIKRGKSARWLDAADPAWCQASVFVWRLAADVAASARRRFRLGELEDAFLRAYRVLELMGQAALFARGIDSEDANQEDERIARFLEYRNSRKDGLEPNKEGKLQLARQRAAQLLKHMRDPLGPRLLKQGEAGGLAVKMRNLSLLIHGFGANVTQERKEDLDNALTQVERLLKEALPEALRPALEVARFPF